MPDAPSVPGTRPPTPLGPRLAGRNLPGGATLGERLATLRRRGLSQDDLARCVGVMKPTTSALERQDRGRLATLQAVLTALGAGASLAPRDAAAAFFTHAGNASVDHRWETPPGLLDALSRVFGRFDLDPCAPRRSRTRVKARVRLTPDDDRLSLPWHGVMFVNPPYGRALAAWVAKRPGARWRRAGPETLSALAAGLPEAWRVV